MKTLSPNDMALPGPPSGQVFVAETFCQAFEQGGLRGFEDWMGLEGIPFEEVSMRAHRPVVAIRLEGVPRAVFLKRNYGPPRHELLLHKLGLVPPPSEARKEVEKLALFQDAGIRVPEVVAWGEGHWKGQPGSFVATLDLEALPLERYLFRNWTPPLGSAGLEDKRRIIEELAHLTRRMHQAGLVHRDFYFGHIFVSESTSSSRLAVLDVQRASQRPLWWIRSRIKDLASLHFSADPVYIRTCERVRFLKTYWECEHLSLWRKFLIGWIIRKAARIRRHTERSMGISYSEFFKSKYY
jgi:heptose I phosphotransferase